MSGLSIDEQGLAEARLHRLLEQERLHWDKATAFERGFWAGIEFMQQMPGNIRPSRQEAIRRHIRQLEESIRQIQGLMRDG